MTDWSFPIVEWNREKQNIFLVSISTAGCVYEKSSTIELCGDLGFANKKNILLVSISTAGCVYEKSSTIELCSDLRTFARKKHIFLEGCGV
ncbi:hypothetical protein JTB14_004722 [Gonioctena quinquepunctata]|nr:hypothetical protein JTB14_004722 [Gonioctena quinquepunctata]